MIYRRGLARKVEKYFNKYFVSINLKQDSTDSNTQQLNEWL